MMAEQSSSMVNLPNALSFSRLCIAPVLILCIGADYKMWFVLLFALAMLTDMLDGYFARKLNLVSDFGSKLDSISDFVIWTTAVIGMWILWHDVLWEQRHYVLVGIVAAVIPILVSFGKYGAIASYHHYSMKVAAVAMGPGVLLLLLKGTPWLFQASIIFQVVAAIEDVAITLLLNDRHFNVPSFIHARKLALAGQG